MRNKNIIYIVSPEECMSILSGKQSCITSWLNPNLFTTATCYLSVPDIELDMTRTMPSADIASFVEKNKKKVIAEFTISEPKPYPECTLYTVSDVKVYIRPKEVSDFKVEGIDWIVDTVNQLMTVPHKILNLKEIEPIWIKLNK